jgi:hypothetical protein
MAKKADYILHVIAYYSANRNLNGKIRADLVPTFDRLSAYSDFFE